MIQKLDPWFVGSRFGLVQPAGSVAARGPGCMTALPALACILLAGCAAHTQRYVGHYVDSVLTRPASPAGGRVVRPFEPGEPAVFTFSQACERAAEFDQEIAGALADVGRLATDVDQARSQIWPRVDVRTYFQIPLGGSNLQGIQIFNGGVFFRYDFERMLFSGDAAAAARARTTQNQEKLQLLLDRLSEDLFFLLADRENLRADVVLRRSMQAQTSEALERAHLLERTGRVKPDRVLDFEYQYETSSRLYQEAVRHLAEINRALASRLLLDPTQDVVITDMPELLSSIAALAPVAAPDAEFFCGVWEKRHDTKAAEAELFVKEMAVIEERRKRIPSLTASFGLGSLSLASTFSQAPVVLQLGASMPLVDFGDIKRQITKATIERDLARRNISTLLLRVQRGVFDSSAAFFEAIAAQKAAESQRRLISGQSDASQKLVAAGLVDPIDLFNFKMRVLELDIEVARARANVVKAGAEYAFASGHGLVRELRLFSWERQK